MSVSEDMKETWEWQKASDGDNDVEVLSLHDVEGTSGFKSEEKWIQGRGSSKNPELLPILFSVSLQVKSQDLCKRTTQGKDEE